MPRAVPSLISRCRGTLESLPFGRTHVEVDVNGDVPGGVLGAMLAEGFLRKELTTSLDRLRALGEVPIG